MADFIDAEEAGWRIGNDYPRESLQLSPEPPPSHVLHRVEWWSQRVFCDLRSPGRRTIAAKAAIMSKALAVLPKWATRAPDHERRAAIHQKLLRQVDIWDGKRSLVILGPTGLGKTTALVELAFQGIAHEIDPLRWVAPAFHKATELTQAWRTTKLGEDAIDAPCVTTAKGCPLLFIDDIGQEPSDPQAALMGIADTRYDKGLVSVVTSGLTLDAFMARYGDAFIRRFMDAGGKDSGKVVDLWRL